MAAFEFTSAAGAIFLIANRVSAALQPLNSVAITPIAGARICPHGVVQLARPCTWPNKRRRQSTVNG